jgi:hypothetical protein
MALNLLDLLGTSRLSFRLGKAGLLLKSNGADLSVRNPGDTLDAPLVTSLLKNSGDFITINSDAAGTGADWSISVLRPTSGMTANRNITLPGGAPAAGNIIQTDASGNWTYVAPSSGGASAVKVDTTTLAFGTASPVTTSQVINPGDILDKIKVVVDTAFNGTPTLTVGIAGTTSKYMVATDSDLNVTGTYEVNPDLVTPGAAETIILTYAAGGATVGSARIMLFVHTPT